jgi:uncharacterized delta-60 repeat protein
MRRPVKIKVTLVAILVLLLVMVSVALAADPTDKSFGTKGIAEIEASLPEGETDGFEEGLGSIVDLEPDGHGKLLAAVGPIPGSIKRNHFFAAARILPDGHPDPGFGRDGLTRRRRIEIPNGEGGAAGVLRAEAVAPVKGGKVLLAGYFDDGEAYAPVLARFTPQGRPDPSFGHGGRWVYARLSGRNAILRGGQRMAGGERIHDVAVGLDGTIVGVGDVVAGPRGVSHTPQPAALVRVWRPDGVVDHGFGRDGRLTIRVPREGGYSGFSRVKILPSGKMLVAGYLSRRLVVYRLTADGRVDRSFGDHGRVTVGRRGKEVSFYYRASLAVDRDGRIVLGGMAILDTPVVEAPVLLRLLPDGRRDHFFGGRSVSGTAAGKIMGGYVYLALEPRAVTIDGRGRVVVTGGEFTTAGSTDGKVEGHEALTSRRFLPDGRPDRSFGRNGIWFTDPPGSRSTGYASATQPDGRVIAGGWVQLERGSRERDFRHGNTAMLLTRYR